MDCQQFQRQVVDYLENQLPLAERAAVATHLTGCADCAAWAQQLSRLDAALTRAVQAPALRSDFSARLRDRIQTAGALLSERERSERQQELRIEFETGLVDLRRRSFGFASLMDNLGWVVLAVWAAWLFWTAGRAATNAMVQQEPVGYAQILCLSLLASGVFVLVGLSVAFQRRFTWMSGYLLIPW